MFTSKKYWKRCPYEDFKEFVKWKIETAVFNSNAVAEESSGETQNPASL